MSLSRPIVIIGAPSDEHVAAVREQLAQREHDVLVLNPLEFPDPMRLSLGEQPDDVFLDDVRLALPRAVYIRSSYASPLAYGVAADNDMDDNWRRCLIAYREKNAVISSVLRRWETLGVPTYNPLSCHGNITKPYQLALLAQHGLPVPASLWTNDPPRVRAFAEGRRVVFKPVVGGAATRELRADDLTDERLSRLDSAPVTFQELLPGEDIRVYIVDGKIVARLRIDATDVDFRQNETSIEHVDLPAETQAQCIRAADVLGLRFTGMDLKRDARGELRILELNESPMFLGFDNLGVSNVLGALTARLAAHPSRSE